MTGPATAWAAAPFLLKGGLSLAAFFALLFAGPDLGSTVFDATWVLVMFVACGTTYAFFQVPYVAMLAEITDSCDERSRLMTWRAAILAFAIMLSGASAPAAPCSPESPTSRSGSFSTTVRQRSCSSA